jgi:hypothetical protein
MKFVVAALAGLVLLLVVLLVAAVMDLRTANGRLCACRFGADACAR